MESHGSRYNKYLDMEWKRWHGSNNSPFILSHTKSVLNHTSKRWVSIIKFFMSSSRASTSSSKFLKMVRYPLVWCQVTFHHCVSRIKILSWEKCPLLLKLHSVFNVKPNFTPLISAHLTSNTQIAPLKKITKTKLL